MESLFSHFDINSLIIALVGVGVFFFQLRNGTSKISADTIEAYKNQVELYEKRLGEQTSSINTMATQIGELRGTIVAKDKQIDDMRKILENRNPELETVLSQLTKFMESVDKRLTEHGSQLAQVIQYQGKSTTITSEIKP